MSIFTKQYIWVHIEICRHTQYIDPYIPQHPNGRSCPTHLWNIANGTKEQLDLLVSEKKGVWLVIFSRMFDLFQWLVGVFLGFPSRRLNGLSVGWVLGFVYFRDISQRPLFSHVLRCFRDHLLRMLLRWQNRHVEGRNRSMRTMNPSLLFTRHCSLWCWWKQTTET